MFETLQNIRVFMTCSIFVFVFFEGGSLFFIFLCVVNLDCVNYFDFFFLEINIKLKFIRFFVHFSDLSELLL